MRKKFIVPLVASLLVLAACGPTTPTSSNTSEEPSVGTTSEEPIETGTSEEPPAPTPTLDLSAPADSLYITKTLQLSAQTTDFEGEVTFESSSNEIATVDANGLVTAVAPGEVTITAKAGDLTDSVTLTVKDILLDISRAGESWSVLDVYQDDPTVTSEGHGTNYLPFKIEAGKTYMASATVTFLSADPDGTNTWSGVSIMNVNAEGIQHGTLLSPGPTLATAPKLVTYTVDAAGNVKWGIETDRSQIWNHHGLSSLDFSAPHVLTTIRDGNEYYYYIDGELYWYENIWTNFNEQDTRPALYFASASAKYEALSVTTEEAAIEAYIAEHPNNKLYPTDEKYVSVEEGGKKVVFTGADEGAPLNVKDTAAKTIGDAFILPAEKASRVTFDLVIDRYGATDAMPAVLMTINRHDENFPESRSCLISEFKVGFTGWNYNGDLPGGIGAASADYNALEQGKTYKVTCDRLMYEDGQDTRILLQDEGGETIMDFTHNWHDGYRGAANVFFAVRNMNATLSNITLTTID